MNNWSEREDNAASIRAIPFEELPDSEARAALVRRALAGQDVYAYVPCASDHCVVWVRQDRPDVEARFRPMEWARLWHSGLQPDGTGLDTPTSNGGVKYSSLQEKPHQRRSRRLMGRGKSWLFSLSVLLVGISVLSACDMGPTTDPPTAVVTAPPSVPHRGPVFLQISPDDTGSYPRSLMVAFLQQMAGWVDQLPAINSEQATVYVTYINSQPYLPASTPVSFTIPRVSNWPLQQLTPVPSCPDNPYSCSDTQATVTAANATSNVQYQQQITKIQAQLVAVEQWTKQQTKQLAALRPVIDNRSTSIWGVLNLAAQRFKGTQGEKYLILASDLGNNTAIDEVPPDLTGFHIIVAYMYCTSAVSCQNTKATWSAIFKRAHAASWRFLDPSESQTLQSPWS
jgi:hypothetical protein